MTNYGITTENLIRTLPSFLRNDEKMRLLATVISDILSARTDEIDTLRIYTQIDKLPEPLLDILAYDFKVDWYGYDYGIEAKRALLKDSFNVHRHLGTLGAVEKALNDIYPGSEVEEWFDYGGNPYYFRVLLDVTNQLVSISHEEIIRAIEMFKSLRSHLQDNTVIYRSRVRIVIGVVSGYVIYGTRLCGTYPARATQGGIESSGIDIETDGGGVAYSTRLCGTALGSII
ncbi:MAG: phage tail protein I [Vallitaleaceae bacterium]|nr:phage tail protein I [Vallitaleaceae bacterium]